MYEVMAHNVLGYKRIMTVDRGLTKEVDVLDANTSIGTHEAVSSNYSPSRDLMSGTFAPGFPEKPEDLDVDLSLLADLTLKILSIEPDCTTSSVSSRLRLGILITETILQRLHRNNLVEIKGLAGLHNHRYSMLNAGWEKAKRLIDICSYIGPAPVSLRAYSALMSTQVRSRGPSRPDVLQAALQGLVLSEETKQTLGLVASSGRSVFLSGPSGNGKTAMARSLANALDGDLWVPYAIEVDGHIIRVYDPHTHEAVVHRSIHHDRRWIQIRPPLIVVGGELVIGNLDLTSTETARYYEAPLQVKSNGGVFVVDDLGRQRCPARELLNRWIIPLENRFDYLTLSTGKKIQVPFEQIVVFATNLTEKDLVDEAFLRRMGYRLHVSSPTRESYTAIFTDYAKSRGLEVNPQLVNRLFVRYLQEKRLPKACESRDLIERAIEICKFRQTPSRLTEETLNTAWNVYFGVTSESAHLPG